jgi:hypothetical protein
VVIFLAGTLILWLILIWLVRKIICGMKPLKLIDYFGTVLYDIKNGDVNFFKMIGFSDRLEKFSFGQLNRDFIELRVLEEVEAESIIPLNSDWHIGLVFKVKKLSFIFHFDQNYEEEHRRKQAMTFFQYYGNHQRASGQLRMIANYALEETIKEVIKKENGILTIAADGYILKDVFVKKLEAALKKEKHLYALCDERFDFSFQYCQDIRI